MSLIRLGGYLPAPRTPRDPNDLAPMIGPAGAILGGLLRSAPGGKPRPAGGGVLHVPAHKQRGDV